MDIILGGYLIWIKILIPQPFTSFCPICMNITTSLIKSEIRLPTQTYQLADLFIYIGHHARKNSNLPIKTCQLAYLCKEEIIMVHHHNNFVLYWKGPINKHAKNEQKNLKTRLNILISIYTKNIFVCSYSLTFFYFITRKTIISL